MHKELNFNRGGQEMKHLNKIILVLIASCLVFSDMCLAAPSQTSINPPKGWTAQQIRKYNNFTRFNVHNIQVWVGDGYGSLLNNGANVVTAPNYTGDFTAKSVGGNGFMIGLGYEYNWKNLIVSVGPEFRLFSVKDNLTFSDAYHIGLPEYNQTKHYQFLDMTEKRNVGQILLPVMVGGQWDKVYFKAGVKVGYNIFSSTNQQAVLHTSITDPLAYDNAWTDIPGHNLSATGDYSIKDKNSLGLDITASAEVGVNLDQLLSDAWQKANEKNDRPLRMRLAAFVDYGIPNMSCANPDLAMASVSTQDITTVSWLNSQWGASKLNSLMVGIKFTFLLQMNHVGPVMKNEGYMAVYTYDQKTKEALNNTALTIAAAGGKPQKRTTKNKGLYSARMPEDNYTVSATHSGYLPKSNISFHHGYDNDTLSIGLIPDLVYTCFVRDAKTNQYLAATLRFVNAATGETVFTENVSASNPSVSVKLPFGGQYKVRIEAVEHFTLTENIRALDATDEFKLQPIEKKRAIVLKNLYFATNETTILPESEPSLQDLYDLLSDNPKIRIRIIGHTDNVGKEQANQILSEGRANSVRNDMIQRGIDPSRIEAEGRGMSQPIDTNDTEEGRANNRRVEFVVL